MDRWLSDFEKVLELRLDKKDACPQEASDSNILSNANLLPMPPLFSSMPLQPVVKIDPADGKEYTWDELHEHCAGKQMKRKWSEDAIKRYWDNKCTQVGSAQAVENIAIREAEAQSASKDKAAWPSHTRISDDHVMLDDEMKLHVNDHNEVRLDCLNGV